MVSITRHRSGLSAAFIAVMDRQNRFPGEFLARLEGPREQVYFLWRFLIDRAIMMNLQVLFPAVSVRMCVSVCMSVWVCDISETTCFRRSAE